MSTLLTKLVGRNNQPVMVTYNNKDQQQSSAFMSLLLDFYDETEPDDEINQRFQTPLVKLLRVRGDYVGFLAYKLLDEGKTVYVTTFGVSSKARGKGYGKFLFSSFIDECHQSQEHECIRLGVRANNAPALGLYKKLGFKQIKHGKEGSVDFLILQLKL